MELYTKLMILLFKKDWEMGYFLPRNSLDQNPHPWITPEKIRLMVKFHENEMNTNRISTPISPEDRKRIGEFNMRYQHFAVSFTSTRNF